MDHGERRGEMQWSRRWRDLQMTSSRIRLIELPLTGFIALTCAQSWHFLVHRHRQDGCVQPSLGIRCQSAPRTRPYNSTWNIPAVFHEPGNQGNSPRKQGPPGGNFYSAAAHQLPAADTELHRKWTSQNRKMIGKCGLKSSVSLRRAPSK
jgi:hypothetical protein